MERPSFAIWLLILGIIGVDSHRWRHPQFQGIHPRIDQTHRSNIGEAVQGSLPELSAIEAQWICTNQKTGDMMIIGTDALDANTMNNGFPLRINTGLWPQQQSYYPPQKPQYPHQPQHPYQPQHPHQTQQPQQTYQNQQSYQPQQPYQPQPPQQLYQPQLPQQPYQPQQPQQPYQPQQPLQTQQPQQPYQPQQPLQTQQPLQPYQPQEPQQLQQRQQLQQPYQPEQPEQPYQPQHAHRPPKPNPLIVSYTQQPGQSYDSQQQVTQQNSQEQRPYQTVESHQLERVDDENFLETPSTPSPKSRVTTMAPDRTTSDLTKKFDNFDWTSYEKTLRPQYTKLPNPVEEAEFDGQGIIQPRMG